MKAQGVTVDHGHYARKQIFSRSRVVAWSHSRRLETALRLVRRHAGGRLLDFGCGDGTFLAISHGMFPEAVGTDVDHAQLEDCRRRLASLSCVKFQTVDAIREASWDRRFDVVVCMEVLEHCPEQVRRAVVDDLARLIAPGGSLVVSVPLESGASLAVKQVVRGIAAASGLSEYDARERYAPREFARMVFAGASASIPRDVTVVEHAGRAFSFTGHKGFNWRQVERELRSRYRIERRLFSPMPMLRSVVNSQAWFVCRPA